MENLINKASSHLKKILEEAIQLTSDEKAVVIFDTQAPLARLITEAYRQALPQAQFIDFDTMVPPDVLRMIESLKAKDLIILVQSTNFRLSEFRIRIELFKRDLKTIEHIHLARMTEDQFPVYIESLAYDPNYYRPLGKTLKEKLERGQEFIVECAGTKLVYAAPMEEAKLNVGDYTGMKNIGGTFPIGEVFTEPKDLRAVNGTAMVFAFAGDDHIVRFFTPFPVEVNAGILTAPQGPPEFKYILEKIKEDEEVLVREFGLGINPAMGKHQILNDITAFERQKGLHLSLGEKHSMYPKPGLSRKGGRYHVDVFVDVEKILIDGKTIFERNEYTA